MLKHRYRFKMSFREASALQEELTMLFTNFGDTKELHVMLPLAVLMDLHKRLAGSLLFPAKETKVLLKQPEALAFQLLYRVGMIRSTNECMQIAHSIDTTI